jgi:4-hydroxybenzoate polyprenyltransferase
MALAVVAGAVLALANAYADIEEDRRSGVRSIAVFLGRRRTLLIDAVLLAVVQLIALATTVGIAGLAPLIVVEAAGCGLSWFGLSLATFGRDGLRRLVWEVQAVGMVVLGMAWLVALNSAGLLRS